MRHFQIMCFFEKNKAVPKKSLACATAFVLAINGIAKSAEAGSNSSIEEASSQSNSRRVFVNTSELVRIAEQGNAKAQNDLGFRYQEGIQVPKSGVEAVKWYRKAADQGFAEAQANMGFVYDQGIGVQKNHKKAFEWYSEAARQGFSQAQYELGFKYHTGSGVTRNDAEAFKWYCIASQQYDAEAQYKVGSEAVKWHAAASSCAYRAKLILDLIDAAGSSEDQFNIGLSYKFGFQVKDIRLPKNDIEAAKWFRKAAEKGYADAQSILGGLYEAGEGVPMDNFEAVKWWRMAAEQGNASAQDHLGVCYQFGRGVDQNSIVAVKWFRKAADQGNAGAQENLAVRYQLGQGVPEDKVEAVRWYRKAAEQGLDSAQDRLAECYYEGEGVPMDIFEAVKWWRMAAEQGNASAQDHLGVCYQFGRGVETNELEAIKWYKKEAESYFKRVNKQNNLGKNDAVFFRALGEQTEKQIAEIQYSLGVKYANGLGVPKDETEARKWFQEAADRGHIEAKKALDPSDADRTIARNNAETDERYRNAGAQADAEAQLNLGVRYYNGRGVPKDRVEAVKWYLKAAEQGLAKAQLYLGDCYYNGQGVPEDQVEAVKWFRKAANQGNASAQFNLGVCCAKGKGVPKDEAEAVKWYRKAADQGYAEAQLNLGFCCDEGQGVRKDQVEAVKWYRKAAEQGLAKAQLNMGSCYDSGQGVSEDRVEAVKWYRKAAEQGLAEAQFNMALCYHDGQGVPRDVSEAYKWLLLAGAQGYKGAEKLFRVIENQITAKQRAEGQRAVREFSTRATPTVVGDISEAASPKASPKSFGTGFFITEDGYFITNQHVAASGSKIKVITPTEVIPADVIKVDKVNDLSLLKANGHFVAVPLISSARVRLGATAFTIGFPNPDLQGFNPKLAKGEIASLAGARDDPRHFQISAPVQPGSSGGALVDERGNVVGVVVARLSQRAALETSGELAENVNYAVKSSYLLSFLESVPDVVSKLKDPIDATHKFEDVVKTVEQATVMVLVY